MKTKLLFCIAIILFVFVGYAQNSIPNGNFETWNTVSFESPQYYPNTSNNEAFQANMPSNCIKSTDSYHGSYALSLTTEVSGQNKIFGYIVDGNPNGNPATWHGGIPYSLQPTGITGYYKSAIAAGDSAFIIVAFSKAGTNIGFYTLKLYGTHNTYTSFNLTFSPALAQAPDSVTFAATSSNPFSNTATNGSMLLLDYVSFTGVASQPAQLNGDFETWQTQTLSSPTSWYIMNNMPGQGVFKSTSAYLGSGALELKTYLGDNNGSPAARAGNASTGYYPQNCSGSCTQQGGYPFNHQNDTLIFWYKYSPSINDTAQVFLNFKKNGSQIWGTGHNLTAAASYTYVEIPCNLSQVPDTAIVSFQSSLWQDSLVSYVGSDLIVDEVHFKSQPLNTGIANLHKESKIMAYPNPSKGLITIVANTKITEIEIMNVLGEKVYSENANSDKATIDLSNQPKGIYFYRLISDQKTLGTGKISLE